MNIEEAKELMLTVQAVEDENDLYQTIELADLLAAQVRQYCESEAESGGWYADLMKEIGEWEHEEESGEPCPADFQINRWRVHLVYDGQTTFRNPNEPWHEQTAYTLPLVEFYKKAVEVTVDPHGNAAFPVHFTERYAGSFLAANLLGIGGMSFGSSIADTARRGDFLVVGAELGKENISYVLPSELGEIAKWLNESIPLADVVRADKWHFHDRLTKSVEKETSLSDKAEEVGKATANSQQPDVEIKHFGTPTMTNQPR